MTPEENIKDLNETEKGAYDTEVSGEMKKAYLDYAMSVIVSRAIPSVEDGLKPVQRRILYSMNQMGLKPGTQTKKSARIVGDVIGKFHPHGDSAVYDALVRMAQDFSLRYPLVFGQGNFGCFTADTKVKLTDGRDLSFLELIKENKQGKRNFTFTIDETLNVKIAEIKNPRKTKINAEIMKVTLDNGEEIKCTINHKFMLKDGSYKEAKDLDSGDSLMPIYMRLSTKKDNSNPRLISYNMVFQPKKDSWDFVHLLADNWNVDNNIYQKNTGRIRHHVNFDKLNNNPDNVRRMHWKEHWKIHSDFVSDKHKSDENYRKKLAEGRDKFWSSPKNRESYSKRMSERNLKNWKKKDYQEKMKITLSEVNKKYLKEHPEKIEEIRKTASITMKKLWQIPEYQKNDAPPHLKRWGLFGARFLDARELPHSKECGFQNSRHKKLFNEKIIASNKKRETNLTGKRKFLNICNYLAENNLSINKENYERARKEIFGIKSFTTWDLGIKKYFQDSKNLVLLELNRNHKVVKTEFLNEFTDVYDITIDKTHNFSLASGVFVHNSVDGDPPAAYRYTEAKLMPISSELLQDIDKETVKFVSNFDNSLKEPELLPGKLPALLLNGATGIAVGMATNIPPHNLTEVCNAIIAYVKNPEIKIGELCEIVTGPDFPTGGAIQGDMLELYKTGRGRLLMRGKINTEVSKNKEAVVITEIPYMVNKASLVTQIANLVESKKLKNISDLRDESSKGKIRIVLELKKDTNSKFVTNALYKYTRLQDSFNVNFLALVGGQPKVLGLKDAIKEYVNYRKLVITNRTKFELKKAKERIEIVEGLLIALKNIDEVIRLIKKSKGTAEALESLITKFKLSRKQAQAVLETKLQQLTSLEQNKLNKESKELNEKISEFEKILGDINEILKIIVKEVNELKNKYRDNRRTRVVQRITEISEKDLVQKKDVVVTITEKGYCKRMDVRTYKEQKRGGRGVIGSGLATGDFVKQLITCSTYDYLMFFTTRGRVLWLKAYDVPSAERYSKGKAIVNLLNLKDEKIANVISVKNLTENQRFSVPKTSKNKQEVFGEDYLFMATRKGVVKKISLSHFSKPRASGVRAINLPPDNSDFLIGVELVKSGQEVALSTKKGQAIRFNSNDVRDMGRVSYGVTGIKMNKDDEVVSLEVLDTQAILTITKEGYGKRTAVKDYRKTARAGKGVINLKVSEKTGDVVATVSVNDTDSIIITTAKGIVIRTSLKNIRVMGRAAQGVRIVKLQSGDFVTDLIKVVEEIKKEDNGD